MTPEEIKKELDDLKEQFRKLSELVRRHKHDNIETDKLPFSSFQDWGTAHQILTSRGAIIPPHWDLPGVSPSSSASASLSPSSSASSSASASRSPSASLSPSASRSPSSSASPSI